MSMLEARDLSVGYEGRIIVKDISLSIPESKISVILGANGSGKSTLLKAFARLLRPSTGSVLLDDKPVGSYSPRSLAQRLGFLPQSPLVPEGICTADLVSRGRFPYRHLFGGMSRRDFEAVHEALTVMGVKELADCAVDELSGGQRQRVWLALALAQETDILILDEPTTFLDIAYQIDILDTIQELNRNRGTTILIVLHDINLSARYADYLFALKEGRLEASGPPAQVITPDLIKLIYGLDCIVSDDPVSHTPLVVPRGRRCTGD